MRAAGTGFADGRWSTGVFMETPAHRSCGRSLAEFMEQPRPHATGPLLRPVSVGIDIGGHYGPQVADFVKDRGAGYQCVKGLPPQRLWSVYLRDDP